MFVGSIHKLHASLTLYLLTYIHTVIEDFYWVAEFWQASATTSLLALNLVRLTCLATYYLCLFFLCDSTLMIFWYNTYTKLNQLQCLGSSMSVLTSRVQLLISNRRFPMPVLLFSHFHCFLFSWITLFVWMDMKLLIQWTVSPGQPSSISDDADVFTLVGSGHDAADLVNQKEIHWGVSLQCT